MEQKPEIQIKKIIRHLEVYGVVDNFWSIETKTSLRLGARIFDLKTQGWRFRTEKQGKNYFYHLLNAPETPNPAPQATKSHTKEDCPSYKSFKVYCPICRIKEEKKVTLF